MADCDNIPTLDTVQKFNTNAKVTTEVVTSTADQTTQTDSTGKTHRTFKGMQTEFDNQLSDNQTTFDNQLSDNQTTFDNQLSDNQTTFDNQLSDNQTTFDNQLSANEAEHQSALNSFDTQASAALAQAGYVVVGTFADGVTVSNRSEAVYYAGDPLDNYANEAFYIWTGVFDKVVTAGDTPFDESGWMLAATGYTKQSSAVQLFGQTIDADLAIPVGQNALSINPAISEGVTVTVPEGSTWVILGSTN